MSESTAAVDRMPELREWMRRTATTPANLAALLKLTPSFISQVLGGTREFSVENVIKLSLLTDIPADRLASSEGAAVILKLYGERQGCPTCDNRDKSNVA